MKTHSRVYAKINLNTIRNNVGQLRQGLKPGTKIVAVVKADGYGHGAVPVARALEGLAYVWGFAVATLEEGIELREAGIDKSILILGYTFPGQYEEVVRYNLTPAVFKLSTAKALSAEATRQNKQFNIQIKVDTGMNRIGYKPGPDSLREILAISHLPGLNLEAIYTHFVKADETDKTFSYRQIDCFEKFVAELAANGLTFPLKHCAGSAGTIDLNAGGMDLARGGIAMYGLYPSEEVAKDQVKLQPAMELLSQVVYLKDLLPGETVSYGATFQADKKMKIATIPVGYGDGYPRSLSGKGYVLIRGQKAPILGRICMDQFMVDVSHIAGIAEGDNVTLIGKSENEYLPVEALSELSGRFNYEFVCNLGKRIPRVYVADSGEL